MSPGRTENDTRPHHMGRAKGTTWQGKTIHPRIHHWVRTSIEGHRTPVRTSPELPRRHDGSLGGGGAQVSPSMVLALARSRDGEDPGMSKGLVLARVQALPYT
jgi:hypothetical protein